MRIVLLLTALSTLLLTGIITGCGGGNSAPQVTVAILPGDTTVDTEGDVQFIAIVTGASNTAVTWEVVEGEDGGSITNTGLYQAPAATGIFTVKATSVADTSKSDSVLVTVQEPQFPVEISISPDTITLYTEGTQQFIATVTHADNTAVTWSTTSGTVNDGLYTAPTMAGTYYVTATSVEDNTKFATATVTVEDLPLNVDVSVSPSSVSLNVGGTQQFTADVTGTDDDSVIWSVEVGGGGIDEGGFYTAPATPGVYTVTATSVADNTKFGTAVVTVNPLPSTIAIAIGPHTINPKPNDTRQFHYSIVNATDTSVTWSTNGGTITSTGFYTAPATVGDYTVTVTSVQDPTKSDTANVRVRN